MTFSSTSAVTVGGSPRIYVNGGVFSDGQAVHAVSVPLALATGSTEINVSDGIGRLETASITNASGAAPTVTKTGAGELRLKGGFSVTGTAPPATFRLREGVVTLATSLQALGGSGNNNYTAAVLRLEGGGLQAVSSGTIPPQYAAYAATSVQPDAIVSGTVTFGDPSGAANTRLAFSNGFRLEQDSKLVVHNETMLYQSPQGAHTLTVGGPGRLVLNSWTAAASDRLSSLVIDGGNVGVFSGTASVPVGGVTLANGGRLDSLRPFALTPTQQVTIIGAGTLRSAGPYSDMTIGTGNLVGDGTLSVEATLPPPPPNMPSAYYVQPGRIRITGSNTGFTGNTVVNGGELVVSNPRGLGGALLAGGTQTVTVAAGGLTVSGSTMAEATLARVVVNKGGSLKFAGGNAFALTSQNVPVAPIAGLVGLEFATLSGSGVGMPLADGAIVQNAGISASAATLGCDLLYSGSAAGSVTLAGTFIPNRGFAWGGVLNVTGQLRTAGPSFDLQVSGAGVVIQNAQVTFTGSTTIANGRLELRHVDALGFGAQNVLIAEGSQLDLAAAYTAANLPTISPASAGMLGVSSLVSNTTVQGMTRGGNTLGPAYSGDYTYNLSSLSAESGVYRFGTVSAPIGSPGFQMPRSFTITGSHVLTGAAEVIVGAVKGKALGSGGSTLTLNANQDFTGNVTVLPDFFLASERQLAQPFGTGTAIIRGKLLATGSAGSFTSLTTAVQFESGGELWLDNSRTNGVNNDRWGDSSPVNLVNGAIRVSGNTNQSQSVTETIGALGYGGRGQIYLNKLTSGSGGLAVTFASLAPQAGSHATLEVVRTIGTEKVYVTQAPGTVGSANLVPRVIDVKAGAPMTWDPGTGELVVATPDATSLANATASAYVSLTTSATVTGGVSMLALRTTQSIQASGSAASLAIGDGSVATLLVAGFADIRPRVVFQGEGLIYTGSNAYARLWGPVDAPNGLVKMGSGNLILSNTTAVVTGSAVGSQTLRVREGRLSGSGSKLWNVIVEAGGSFAPGNSPDITELGGLTLSGEASQEFELTSLDQVSDKTIVASDVTLDGFIDIIDWEVDGVGTMEVGTYNLITWGGTLTDNGIELRTMPDGFDGYLNVDNTTNTLQLVVVPEPAALVLAVAGCVGVLLRQRRRRRADGLRAA